MNLLWAVMSDMAGQSLRAKQEGISSTAEATRKRGKSVKNIVMAKQTKMPRK